MDLAKLDTTIAADEGRVLQLRNHFVGELHPDYGQPLAYKNKPISITLLGADGIKFQKAYQKRLNEQRNSGKQRLQERPLNEAEKTELAYNLYADLTLEWHGIIENGEPLECNFRNAKHVYCRFGWLFEQVVEFVSSHDAFLPPKKPRSKPD